MRFVAAAISWLGVFASVAVPDLSVTIAPPGTVSAGVNFSYLITVSNIGTQPATGVVVTNVLPQGVSFVAAGSSAGCASNGGTVTCPAGTLAAGAGVTITVVANAASNGAIQNVAGAVCNEADPNMTNNWASVTSNVGGPTPSPTRTPTAGPSPTPTRTPSFTTTPTFTNTPTPTPVLQSLTLNPTSVVAGDPSVGTVTLTSPAAFALDVTLDSSKPQVAYPNVPSVHFNVGDLSKSFGVSTLSDGSAAIRAHYNTELKQATIMVNPAKPR